MPYQLPNLGRLVARARPRAQKLEVAPRTLKAIAVLLLLAQLPHVLHLPPWVSLAGGAIIGLRLLALRHPGVRALEIALSPLALTGIAVALALLIRLHYDYFLGRDPCVAFLFILVAAKFAEIRRASDGTLLLCLAAFLLLTQYFYSQSILSALVTLPAVLALGHALAVLRDPDNPVGTSGHLKLVGKMLLQGAPIAAVLFVLFPRLPGPLWSLPEDAMATTGLSDSMAPGTIGALSMSEAVAFRVEFDGEPPPRSMRYWRGPVLSRFDGRAWTPGNQFRDPTRWHSDVEPLSYTVMLQPHRQRWYFALDVATSLPRSSDIGSGDSRILAHRLHDGQLVSDKPVTRVTRYRQQSVPSNALVPPQKPGKVNLQLAGKNPRSVAFAKKLRAEVGSDKAFARAVMSRFRQENYFYTLSPQLLGDSAVDEFLFSTMEGFCEHYSSAFVVLMRAAGIPARVVTGYLGGEMNQDYMIVRQSDAHAWSEAFIDGAWRRFDPTGAVAPSRVESSMRSALSDEDRSRLSGANSGWLKDMQLQWDSMNHHWQRLVVDFDNDSQSELWDKLGLPRPELWQLTAFVIALCTAWGLLVLRPARRAARASTPAERQWLRLQAILEANGFERGSIEGPSHYLARVANACPSLADELIALDQTFTRWRFAAVDTDDTALERSVSRKIKALGKHLKRMAYPASTSDAEPDTA